MVNKRKIYVSGDTRESKRQWKIRNKEKTKKENLRYMYERGGLLKNEGWRRKNKEKVSGYKRKYREKKREILNENSRKRYFENRDKEHERARIYRKNNSEKINKYCREYKTKKRKNDIHFKLMGNVSSLIREKLKRRLCSKNNKSTWFFLPYTVDDLIRHLENLFKPGMSWANYGEWHIDHIRPDCKFDYKNVEDEEFQKCWALENLQPLWAEENLRKNNRLIY